MAYAFSVDETRSKTMSRIRSKDTRPEILLRRALWARGLRYRKDVSDLPGRPDIAFIRARVAVFVDGAFWHGHEWDKKKTRIQSNSDYWIPKITRNMARDEESNRSLSAMNWLVLRFWDFEIIRDAELCADLVSEVVRARLADRDSD